MDILTQGLVGGVLAQTVAENKQRRDATVIGMLSGLLADADIIISSASDPLLTLEYHRHFTHSLLFIPFGALIASLLLFYFFRNQLSFQKVYLFALMGYCMSGMLDAFTTYGTNLFWPFSDARVAWNLVSVFDPVFTLALLVALVISLKYSSSRALYFGLGFCACYLATGYIQKHRAAEMAMEIAQQRGHQVIKSVVKPTLANLLLWRSVYIHEDTVYVDAVRPGIFSQNKTYPGDSASLVTPGTIKNISKDSVLYNDIQRFNYFSNGYIVYQEGTNIIGDGRYSMLPNSSKPLWGIEFDPEQPDKHVEFKFYRENSKEIRNAFINMVLGKEI